MNEYLETILRYAFSGMEIFFVIFIFVRKAEKRNAFIVRIMLALLAITASALLFSVVPFISQTAKWINEIIYYIYICGFTYIAINGIFKIEWKSLSFYSAIAITAGLLGNKTFELINAFLGEGVIGILFSESMISELLHISIMFLVYMFVYFVFIKKYNNIEQYPIKNEKYLFGK